MHRIFVDGFGMIRADGTRRRFLGVGRTHEFTILCDRILSLEDLYQPRIPCPDIRDPQRCKPPPRSLKRRAIARSGRGRHGAGGA